MKISSFGFFFGTYLKKLIKAQNIITKVLQIDFSPLVFFIHYYLNYASIDIHLTWS